jgi:hypothetical protein
VIGDEHLIRRAESDKAVEVDSCPDRQDLNGYLVRLAAKASSRMDVSQQPK